MLKAVSYLQPRRTLTHVAGGALLFVAALATGCGSQPATVTGTVTANGEPVTEGAVMFSPVEEGRPAVGDLGPDGKFTLTTAAGAGAEAGPHRVIYAPRDPSEKVDGSSGPRSKWAGWHTPADFTLELKSGSNDFKIELEK